MKPYHSINFKKIMFCWPVFATSNLMACMIKENPDWKARAKALPSVLAFLVITTGVWASFWLGIVWLLMRLASLF
jgi:hypothetical protein